MRSERGADSQLPVFALKGERGNIGIRAEEKCWLRIFVTFLWSTVHPIEVLAAAARRRGPGDLRAACLRCCRCIEFIESCSPGSIHRASFHRSESYTPFHSRLAQWQRRPSRPRHLRSHNSGGPAGHLLKKIAPAVAGPWSAAWGPRVLTRDTHPILERHLITRLGPSCAGAQRGLGGLHLEQRADSGRHQTAAAQGAERLEWRLES